MGDSPDASCRPVRVQSHGAADVDVHEYIHWSILMLACRKNALIDRGVALLSRHIDSSKLGTQVGRS